MKKCYWCAYYKSLGGGNEGNKACHYMLAHGKQRQRTETECLSYLSNSKKNCDMVRSLTSKVSRGEL